MANLGGDLGELRLVVQIVRKETGKTETVELVGFIDEDKLKEALNGTDTQHSGT
jgi:hypothetical protein